MNFDVNTLSALMQCMSAMKPRAEECTGGDADARKTAERKNASVFAMQNGLGDTVEIVGNKKSENQKKATQSNPMSMLLEMMTGAKPQEGGDMMSQLMPMLLNMMSGHSQNKASTAGSGQSSADANTNIKNEPPKSSYKTADGRDGNTACENSSPSNAALKNDCGYGANMKNTQNEKDLNREYGANAKTQPNRINIYAPIAFAGYTLISALNKLYLAKRT